MNNSSQDRLPDNEKADFNQKDEAISDDSTMADNHELTLREQKKIVHRVDRRLVTSCGLLYCISLIDRANLGQVSIAGMTKELNLQVDNRYVRDQSEPR